MDNSASTGTSALSLRYPTAREARLTFATFTVGECNRFAYTACRAIAEQPGGRYNPLLLHGGRGLGKTHLVTALAHGFLERAPGARIARLTAETFTRELHVALRRDQTDVLKRQLRDVDLLIVEDVQGLAGRRRTQEEFFHTFNVLHDQGRQIVLTADRPPRAVPRLEERLANRFAWGLVAELAPLDPETRIAVLERDPTGGVLLPRAVAEVLAEGAPEAGVPELRALAERTRARAAASRRRVTPEVAREVLAVPARRPDVGFEEIARLVCEAFAVRPADLRSRRRTRAVAVPRQLAMYLCRRLTGASYPRIAKAFGRDHATIMHAEDVTERRRQSDAVFHDRVVDIERRLRGDQDVPTDCTFLGGQPPATPLHHPEDLRPFSTQSTAPPMTILDPGSRKSRGPGKR